MDYLRDDAGSDDEGRPMQLLLKDKAGSILDTLDVFGPNHGDQGVTLLGGYEGFYHVDRTDNRDTTAYGEGSQPSTLPRVDERPVKFTLGTQAATPAGWEAVENRLWKFIVFGADCWIRLHSALSAPRELKIRLNKKPKDLLAKGPGLITTGVWEIDAYSWDPWWYSKMLTASIKRSQMIEVSATTGNPQPGSGVWQGYLPLQNPADQRCWPEYSSNQLTNATTVSLPDQLGQRLVRLPVLNAGQEFYVRTDPNFETLMVRDNSQQWANMRAGEFSDVQLEPGMVVPVNAPVRIVGGTPDTEIKVYLIQRWERMFGGEVRVP